MVLERVIQNVRWTLLPIFSSLAISCSSCDKDLVSEAYCQPGAVEICNNYNDDNCNGLFNEGCDVDGDGYCSGTKPIEYTLGKTPEICSNTFQDCITTDCLEKLLDCNDTDNEIYPKAVERCDSVDNNCNNLTDESFPEDGQRCGDNLGANFERDGIGPCQAGTYVCNSGKLICQGYFGPAEKELCNNFSDTCGIEPETPLTEASPCYEQWLEDASGNKVKIQLPLDHPTRGIGQCMAGVLLCTRGVVGGDGECHGAILPEPDIGCDCVDQDCDGVVNNLRTEQKLQYAGAFDTSGSMQDNDNIDKIIDKCSALEVMVCLPDNQIGFSTIRLGNQWDHSFYEPILKRAQVTTNEFKREFRRDIPGAYGPDSEPSANAIVYTACAVIEDKIELREYAGSLPEICQRVLSINSLRKNHPRNLTRKSVFDPAAQKTLIVVSDEMYQWVERLLEVVPPPINQQQAAELTQLAGIKVIVFTHEVFNNHEFSDQNDPNNRYHHGYAYFEDVGGKVFDINLKNPCEYLQEQIREDYCLD